VSNAVPANSASEQVVEMQELVRRSRHVHIVGNRTKSGLHAVDQSVTSISTHALRGIVSYDPQEFVVSLQSGTLVADAIELLGNEGQYLPFDPLLADRGATMGGTVASNAAGSGRFRFGGVRDFLIGVRFIDGRGNCIRGGGQVVKNAAGFDYPKLMVGSRGTLGLIYELTFKVFPRPESYMTVLASFSRCDEALLQMNRLTASPMDVEAIDLVPLELGNRGYELAVRIGGIESSLANRIDRLRESMPASKVLRDHHDEAYWRSVSNLEWVGKTSPLVKLPTTPHEIMEMDARLTQMQIDRRYCVGGNVAWIATEEGTEWKHGWKHACGPGQFFYCGSKSVAADKQAEPGPFGKALKRALDPESKFV
jgi:glycolate oxidase FAD binding subunit